MPFSLPQFRPDQKYDMPYSKPIQELFRLAQTEHLRRASNSHCLFNRTSQEMNNDND